ncbi:hypothetical protein MJO28_009733 [Puccinia striiformis f. sp. tritici]|uniref:Uncharacterized protein n=4 Tax=Puccinia striiformis TaxID=27350 RepID=A0A0L0V804_9BASI|nr:hypothetical protein Pst134EA_017409 [Puccinia striiformis f. sp. tritici]KAI9607394.1 hypothetical protein H4Q26_005914 [Puccinia striiformis f. sp. tritici PST-130]KNE95407.1 hypothetical protein PSTG_11260 [Puccinia striiformis f. sp. tritici PST-78]POW04749.1 hypothetical protein PSHT_11092 [Puccinia striiformis]KAH9450813.1 hypothetical protein Pst134EB_018324 [Puccinia striiformis f. sp. tritici]KAH9461100.1 hypothetical protein Pst134EA_017409 [Puccinia striiformis f. sp. tritici]
MEFNLNELPAESSDEGSFFPTPTPYSIPTVTSAILPRKRKEQPAILSPARSRASRSRLGGDCSGSECVPLRFAGENDVGTSHSGVRESPTVDDSVVESGTSRYNTGNHHTAAIQLFHAPPDDKVMYLSDTTLPGLPPLEQKGWKEIDYAYLISHGVVIEELVNEFSNRFEKKIYSEDCQSNHSGSIDRHPTFSCARITIPDGSTFKKMAKILHHGNFFTQPSWRLYTLYNRLAVCLYKLHGEFCSQIPIPVLHHRDQQRKLFEWLENQIFAPTYGHPLCGIAPMPEMTWRSAASEPQLKHGEIQLELIKYFSEARIDPIISTSYLLGVYRTEHATEYSALRQSAIPSSEFLHRFSMKASFAAMLESFTKLAINLGIARISGQDRRSGKAKQHQALALPYVTIFEQTFRDAEIEKGELRSHFPQLPIALCVQKRGAGPKPLRTINAQGGKINDLKTVRPRFRSLLRSVDYLHIEALRKLQLNESECVARRKSVFQFLLDSVIQPEDSLPLVGCVETPEGIAPWYSESYGKPRSFGELQLKILEYFAEDLTPELLNHVPAFSLAAWHHADSHH